MLCPAPASFVCVEELNLCLRAGQFPVFGAVGEGNCGHRSADVIDPRLSAGTPHGRSEHGITVLVTINAAAGNTMI